MTLLLLPRPKCTQTKTMGMTNFAELGVENITNLCFCNLLSLRGSKSNANA